MCSWRCGARRRDVGGGWAASAPMTSPEFKVGRASPGGEEREEGGGSGGYSRLTSARFKVQKLVYR